MLGDIPSYLLLGRQIEFLLLIIIYGVVLGLGIPIIKYWDQWLPGGKLAALIFASILLIPGFAVLVVLALGVFCLVWEMVDNLRFFFVPRCHKCGEKLVSRKAKQCLYCGADWHNETA